MIIVFIFCFAVRSQILFTFCNLLLSISALVHLSLLRVFFLFSFSLDQLVGKNEYSLRPNLQHQPVESFSHLTFCSFLFRLFSFFKHGTKKKETHAHMCFSINPSSSFPSRSPLVAYSITFKRQSWRRSAEGQRLR